MKRSLFRVASVAAIFGLFAACSDNTSVAPKPGLSPSGPAFDFVNPANGNGACMGNDGVTANGFVSNWVDGLASATTLNCTSNDIDIATTTITGFSFISATGPFTPLAPGDRITCTPGQTIFAQTSAQLENNAQDRYNIGVWIANDPVTGVQGSAVDGQCLHFNLIPGVQGSTQIDGDSCGDMSQGAGLATLDLGALTIVCPAGQATVTVNNCLGWENSDLTAANKRGSCPNIHPGGAQNTISNAQGFRDGTLPETKAKCNCTPFNLPIDVRGKITIVKNTIGGDGSFQFTSDVGSNSNPVVASPFTINTVSLTGSQLIDKVVANTAGQFYHIAESSVDANFTFTSVACTANNAFASATVDQGTKTATITMGNGGDITCTFTNTKKTTLTLVKTVTNNNGGSLTTSDFPLTATGPATISGVSGGTAVTGRVVPAGAYALTEQTQANYTASSWTCSGGTQSGANITLATGGSATCTINNNDNGPQLTLVKTVTNNNGGTKTVSDFALTATGPVTISGLTGATAVTNRVVNAGSYALTEATLAGYTPSSWTCTGGTQTGANIALALGGAATCTINNDDNPAGLTLIKTVTNNNGGTKTVSDFALTASGPVTISGLTGGTAVTGRAVPAGSYALTEATLAGYTPSSWTCSGGTQTGANIAIGLGGSATCTINNDDIGPQLTLVKTVTNNDGGTKTVSDFALTATGPVTISGLTGATAITNRVVNAGSYALTEATLTGYTASSWTCTGGTQTGANIALALGGAATCRINNNDNPATLIITKSVIGPTSQFCYTDTGTGLVASFCLTPATDNGSISQTFSNLSVGTYTVTEDSKTGYLLTDLGCVGGPILDPNATRTVSATLALGQTVTCSFVNQFNASTTRTQGFWATHESITNAVWFGGTVGGNTFTGVTDKTLCGRAIDDINKLLGGFWSNIAFTTGKDKRSDLDKARMQLLQQLLAAILNQAAFGSTPSTITLAAAKAAYCGTNIDLIKDAQTKLAAFNESGDSGTFTPGASANGKQAKDDANLTFWDILP